MPADRDANQHDCRGHSPSTTQAYTADGVLYKRWTPTATNHFNINAADQDMSWIAPNGSEGTIRYDSNGNVISTTDQDGRTINYTYDCAVS